MTAAARPLRRLVIGLVLFMTTAPAGAQEAAPTHAVGMLSVEDVSSDVRRTAHRAVHGENGTAGPMAKIGPELALLYYQHASQGVAGVRSVREEEVSSTAVTRTDIDESASARGPRRPMGRLHSPVSSDGRSVAVTAIASDAASALLSDLQRIGLNGGAQTGTVVSGRLPIAALDEAAGLSALRGMIPAYARTHVGSVESEADTAHRAVGVRDSLGINGSGQKICVLSDSYNQNTGASRSADDDIDTGDLPGNGNPEGNTTPVDVLRDDETSGTDEGRAMLQLIHDIAPGADLGFHTAFGGLAVFVNGIQALADAGCTVIVDDVIFLIEPFYQDGPVALAANDVVNNDDVAYFSSAGNSGQNSYEAPFRGSGEPGVLADTSEAHDFDPGIAVDTRQQVIINEGGTFQVFSLQWTDPSGLIQGAEGPDTDLNVALVDQNDNVVASSTNDNINSIPTPFESFEFSNDGSVDADNDGVADSTFSLVIEKAEGPAPDEVKYIYTGQNFEVKEFDTLGPTVFGHPMAERAEAVAAAPFFNTAAFNNNVESAVLEPFSSLGGIEIRFDPMGTELSTPERRQKPEVTGTDGVDNTFFGQNISGGLDPDFHPNFFGTSAAAPNVAAVAGLIRQADPTLDPADVYDRLESTAADVTRRFDRDGNVVSTGSNGGGGVDNWSGYGFVLADEAVPASDVRVSPLTATSLDGRSRTVDLSWSADGLADEFVVERRFFDQSFVEEVRIDASDRNDFSATIRDLPVGDHRFRISAVRGGRTLTGTVRTEDVTVRAQSVNVTVFPNPFRSVVNLSVTLPDAMDDKEIRVEVYDTMGRRVATPIESRTISDSESISFDAGRLGSLGSGVYFFRVDGDEFEETVQAIHVR